MFATKAPQGARLTWETIGKTIGAAALAAVLLGGLGAAPGFAARDNDEFVGDVPYVPTAQDVVDTMLKIADVGPGDYLIDLGSGDGRIVVTAAAKFGAQGFGVDLNPRRIAEALENAKVAGVSDRAQFFQRNLFETDFSQATVVTMYLLPDVNLLLRPKLRSLPAGTRIVSHDWDMGDWLPERTVEVVAPDKRVGLHKVSRLMRWTV
jgi:SAM-dependent methyltransferase